jgi:hypothetical protein
MLDAPLAWFRRLTLGQEFLASFGIILLLLGVSLGTILFYLSRINSYVDRHNRIAIPAVVTACEQAEIAQGFQQLDEVERRVHNGLGTYRTMPSARTHPIPFGMLTRPGQVRLAHQEQRQHVLPLHVGIDGPR